MRVSLHLGLHVRDIEPVRPRQRQLVDLGSADDEDFGVAGSQGERLVEVGGERQRQRILK